MGRLSRLGYGLAVLLVAAVAATGCGSSKSSDNGGGSVTSKSPVLRFGTSDVVSSINPFVGTDLPDYYVWQYEYPHLIQYDAQVNEVPYLAKSWTTSSDGKTVTLKTVNGKWSDGQPLTAEDAAWTLSTIVKYQAGATANWGSFVAHIKTAVASDPTTLVITYDAAIADPVGNLELIPILPKHIWSEHLGHKGNDLKTFAPEKQLPVVGGGPFVVTDYKANTSATLTRNASFFGPKPAIRVFGLQTYTNPDALVTALKNGQLDAIAPVPASAAAQLKKDDSITVASAPALRTYDMTINSNTKRTEHAELRDPQVRLAFDHATDRKQIIEVALNGFGVPATSLVPVASGKWHNPDLDTVPFDIDKANSILDAAGYKRGSDGIRVANGHPMSYSVLTSPSQLWNARTFDIIQNDYKQIGVKLTDKDTADAFTAVLANKYLTFDLYLGSTGALIDPSAAMSFATCSAIGSQSDTAYCNPAYDKQQAQQSQTVDEKARLAIVYKMQEEVFNDRPYLFLANPSTIEAHTSDWQGFEPIAGSSLNYLSTAFLTNAHN